MIPFCLNAINAHKLKSRQTEYNPNDYWESKFSSGDSIWGFEPADSAIEAVELFKANKFRNILIPGIGYGRNARIFIENGFVVSGIEISGSAIAIARSNNIKCKIHHGSVTSMPFNDEKYDGIFCYALIHVLNRNERRRFLEACFNQLTDGGIMIFIATSVRNSLFGNGKYLSRNRFEVSPGLKVFFYEDESLENEYRQFGLFDYKEIGEPVKFIPGQAPLMMYKILCRK